MRQRILIIASLILLLIAIATMFLKFGKGSVSLAMVSVPNTLWVYEYNQSYDSTIAGGESQHREIMGNWTFKGRQSRGGSRYESLQSFALRRFMLNGQVQLNAAVPWLNVSAPRDARGRLLIGGFADSYPLELLDSPSILPFFTGRKTAEEEEWQDQFRIILPWTKQPLIARMTTKLEKINSTREAVVSYKLEGKCLYQKENPPVRENASAVKEKAVLDIKGQCTLDPVIALPLIQEQHLNVKVFNYNELRENIGNNSEDAQAIIQSITTKMLLKATIQGNLDAGKSSSSIKRTPTNIDNLQ